MTVKSNRFPLSKCVKNMHGPDMDRPYGDIADRLALAVLAFDATDAAFARGAGLTPKAFNNYTSGKYRIGLTAALKLREAYGLPLDWVYCGGSVDKLPSNVRTALESRSRVSHSQ